MNFSVYTYLMVVTITQIKSESLTLAEVAQLVGASSCSLLCSQRVMGWTLSQGTYLD